MRLELTEDGYERIDARIHEIENLALDGAFTDKGATSRFHRITLEVKKLRQTLREVILLNPKAEPGRPDAA